MEEKHKTERERAHEQNETVRRGFPSLLAPALSWATGAGPSSCASIQQLVPNPLGRTASPILSLPAYATQPVCTLLCSMAPHCLLFLNVFLFMFSAAAGLRTHITAGFASGLMGHISVAVILDTFMYAGPRGQKAERNIKVKKRAFKV